MTDSRLPRAQASASSIREGAFKRAIARKSSSDSKKKESGTARQRALKKQIYG